MLKGVRAVIQVVAREHDPALLVEQAAAALAEARGFAAVAIVRPRGDGPPQTTVAGDAEATLPLRRLLASGCLTTCMRKALAEGATVVHPPATDACTVCPMCDAWTPEHDGVAVPIEHDGRRFGALLVKLPDGDASDPEEIEILRELAGDIGLGLHRLEVDAALRRSIEEQQTLFANMLDGCARCRVVFADGVPVDLEYLAINDAFVQLTGLPDVVGRRLSDFVPDVVRDDPELLRLYAGVVQTGEPVRFERREKPHGRWFSIALYRSGLGEFVAIFHDVSARKAAEAALAEAEERHRLALDAADLGTWRHELATDRVELDERAARHFGVPAGAMPFAELLPRIHPDDAGVVRERMAHALDPRSDGRVSTEHRVRLSSGEQRWVSVHVQVRFTGEEARRHPTFAVATTRDITRQKLDEERLAEYREALRGLASRLETAQEEERRRISAGLHDDIGQILAAGRLKVSALRAVAPPGAVAARVDDLDALLRQAGERIRELTFELSAATLYILGFAPAVEELCEHMAARFGMTIVCQDKGSDGAGLPPAAAPAVFRAVRELLFNAVKHAGGTRVTVTLARVPGALEITVEDDGRGFDVAAVARPGNQRSGFGLFNIRERMRDLGAVFWIESSPGAGTRATLGVPLDPPRRESSAD
jgi:PAS domain S-box-containing protein